MALRCVRVGSLAPLRSTVVVWLAHRSSPLERVFFLMIMARFQQRRTLADTFSEQHHLRAVLGSPMVRLRSYSPTLAPRRSHAIRTIVVVDVVVCCCGVLLLCVVDMCWYGCVLLMCVGCVCCCVLLYCCWCVLLMYCGCSVVCGSGSGSSSGSGSVCCCLLLLWWW